MLIELSAGDVQVLRESLRYAKLNIENASDTPTSVRRENLARVESVEVKLRVAAGGKHSNSESR